MKPEDDGDLMQIAMAAMLDKDGVMRGSLRAGLCRAIAAVAPLIAAREREACAALANNIGIERWHGTELEDACDEVAAAIRTRGTP